MKYSKSDWTAKRQRGLAKFLMFDGVLIIGCPFAVIMQVVGFFFLRDEGQGFFEYAGSSRTWTTFFLHATLFGLIMGFLNWRRNENAFASQLSHGAD